MNNLAEFDGLGGVETTKRIRSSGANNAKELPSNSAQCQVQTITNKIDANKSLKLSINLTQCSWVSSGLHWP